MAEEQLQLGSAASGRERLHDSYWVGWTFTLFLNWIAFLWIGFRARNRRWVAWGCVYAVPYAATMVLPEGAVSDAAASALLVLGVASIFHAFKVRPAYIAQRRAITGRPLPERAMADATPLDRGTRAVRALRAAGIVALYVVVGVLVGAVVVFAGALSDPCLPFCVSDGGVRSELVDGILVVGGLAYLALLLPTAWTWNTARVWFVILLGGFGIGALTLLGLWLAIRYTGPPAYCNC